jgi:hypothetical protein
MNRRTFTKRLLAIAATLRLARSEAWSAPQDGRIGGRGRRIVLSCPTKNIDEFMQLADLAAEVGATHVAIEDLPKARWQWFDPLDPYPNWSMLRASFFKIAPPEEMRQWIPGEYAKRCQDILAQRGEVLRKLNLKATFFGAEPMWLPDAVYTAHPDWRGPRCQYPPRARHDYYAPCIDRPEVLAMYRRAVATLCQLVPVEAFSFLTNDSGCGICWHPGLYPGANGPEFCKSRSMNDRLDGWLEAVVAGARDSDCEAEVALAGRWLIASGRAPESIRVGLGPLYPSNFYPVVNIPQPCQFAEQWQATLSRPEADIAANLEPYSPCLFALTRELKKHAAPDPLARYRVLTNVAEQAAGENGAPHLVRAWECIGRASEALGLLTRGGPILLLGSINQRWLVRPLVPFPLELTPEEKDYYRRFQFQAWSEEEAANLMDLQDTYVIQGSASAWLATRIFDNATAELNEARAALKDALAVGSGLGQADVAELDVRLQALLLTIRNASLTVQYQEFLDHMRQTPPEGPDLPYRKLDLARGKKIVEDDMDNTRQLVALLKSTKVSLFATAATAAEEDIFLFTPDLASQLEKKIEIEDRHLPEYLRL